MRRLTAISLALALATATAALLTACGSEDAKLLPGSTADEITENLDTVKQLADEGECVGAADAAEEVGIQVESLQGVDVKLEEALQRGVDRLSEVVSTCEEASTEAVTPSSEAPSVEEEETKQPPGQVKKEEKEEEEPEKEKPAPPKESTTPAETTPAEPPAPPPSEDGGTGAPGGVSPGEPATPEGE